MPLPTPSDLTSSSTRRVETPSMYYVSDRVQGLVDAAPLIPMNSG